jgi:hypothetical protein
MEAADVPKKMFNPFCSVDGMQLSIHCHINAVKTLVCAPGQVAKDRKSFGVIYCSPSVLHNIHCTYMLDITPTNLKYMYKVPIDVGIGYSKSI